MHLQARMAVRMERRCIRLQETTGVIYDEGSRVMLNANSADAFTLAVNARYKKNDAVQSYSCEWIGDSDRTEIAGATGNTITVARPASDHEFYTYQASVWQCDHESCEDPDHTSQHHLYSWIHDFHIQRGIPDVAPSFSVPQTGDDSLPLVWTASALMAFAGMLLLRRRMKRSV